MSHLHLYPTLLIAGFSFYCYWNAVVTNPGVITKENVQEYLRRYDMYDGVLFVRDNLCSTCKIKK